MKSRKAGYEVSRADYVATMVSMTAEIATYYINYRVLQNQISVANEHIQYQAKVVKITEARHEAGLVSKLDVAQSKTVYYTTEASLPRLKAQASEMLNALSILIGYTLRACTCFDIVIHSSGVSASDTGRSSG